MKKQTKQKSELPFMIGCDPEFLMFFGTRGLDASDIIKSFFRNHPEYKLQNDSGYTIPNVGNFGWDGSSSTGELRPVATKNIQTMVDNIGKMLQTLSEKFPTVDLTTLSIGSPIGGHIHLDDFLHNMDSDGYVTINTKAEKIRVENILATYLLPLCASDHRISALNRLQENNGRYGKITDFRFEKKGSIITNEVRGLTAEWMTTPYLTYATFAYIATVWHELKTKSLELNKADYIPRTKQQTESLQRMILGDYKIIERGITQEIRKSIKTFELYPQFKEHIDFILKPDVVMQHKESVGWNINTGWNLNKTKKPTKRALISPNTALNILRKQNIPDIKEHFALMYNDDYNVNLFSTAIAERIAGLNWQLKNDYFLFGFKKDVEGYGAMAPDGNMYTMPINRETEETRILMLRMQERSIGRITARIDPKTGQIRHANNNKKIIIGIPYEDRANKNPKGLIELIYKIENNKIKAQPISTFTSSRVVAKDETLALQNIIPDSEVQMQKYEVRDVIANKLNI